MKRRPLAVFTSTAVSLAATLGFLAPHTSADPAPEPGAAYVALGDSFAAGTGTSELLPGNLCLRSESAYPYRIASDKRFGSLSMEACAGASTSDDEYPLDADEQLGIAAIGPDTRFVTVTIGGNDVQWVEYLQSCAAGTCPTLDTDVLSQLQSRITDLVQDVRAAAPNAKILVTGYPVFFSTDPGRYLTGCSVGTMPGNKPILVDYQTALTVNLGIRSLNATIASGVVSAGVGARYVPISFIGHALCDKTPYFNQVKYLPKGDFDPRSLHPNAYGERTFATTIELLMW